MKKLRKNVIHAKPIELVVIIFFLGLLLGVLFANLFQSMYMDNLSAIDDGYFTKITSIKIEHFKLFQLVLWKDMKEFLLFWVLSITILGIPYMIFQVTFRGFLMGFLLSTATMRYGIKGIILYLTYIFPHYLIYVPVMIWMLLRGYRLCTEFYNQIPTRNKSKNSLILEQAPVFFATLLLIVLGAALEAYINPFILKQVIAWIGN